MFKELVQRRRSHRQFTSEPVTASDEKIILRAALMSPTAKGQRSWRFVSITDKSIIAQLAEAKSSGSQFMSGAPLAIAVIGDDKENPQWIEDCSCAAMTMQYQIEDLGLGSCWIQMRGRQRADGTSTDSFIRRVLGLSDNLTCLCVVAIGHKTIERPLQNEARLKWSSVTYLHS